MATRTWNSSGSTDMNDGSNYTPTGAILASDFLVFDGTSVVNATATGSLSAATIDVIAAYTGAWNDGGQTITLVNSFNMSSGGAFTASGTFNMTANGDLTFKNTGITTTSAWTVDLQGTGNLAWLGYRNLLTLICAAAGKTTTLADGSNMYLRGTPTPLTLGTGTLTCNSYITIASSGYTFTQGTATLNGNSGFVIGGNGTNTINGCAFTGTGTLWIQAGNASTFNLGGDLTTTSGMYLVTQQVSGAAIINSNGHDIIAGTTKTIVIGQHVNDGATFTMNLNGSTIIAGSLSQHSSSLTDDYTIVNLGDAQITLHNTAANADVIRFYSRVVFTQSAKEDSIYLQTNSGKITTAGSIMPSLRMDGSGKTFTLQDDYASLSGYGSIRIDVGTFDTNEKIVICGKDLIVDATETADFTASTIRFYGDYLSASGATVITNASTEFVFYGTNTITTNGIAMPITTLFGNTSINDTCTFSRLLLKDGKTTTFEAGETFTITAYGAADWDGTSGPLRTILRSATPATPFTIVMPSDLAMNYVDAMDCTSDTHTMTVAFGVDGTGNTNWVFTKIDGGAWYSYAQQ